MVAFLDAFLIHKHKSKTHESHVEVKHYNLKLS